MKSVKIGWLICGLTLGFWGAGCSDKESDDIRSVSSMNMHASGFVEPVGGVRTLSFEDPGVIGEVAVKEGALVKQGDILMRLRSATKQAERGKVLAEIEVAKSRLASVKAGIHPDVIVAKKAKMERAETEQQYRKEELKRLETLFRDKGVSKKELDLAAYQAELALAGFRAAKAEHDQAEKNVRDVDIAEAESAVKLAEAQLAVVESELEKMSLSAPADGKVLEVVKREGESVKGDAILLFAPGSELRVRAEVDESFVGRVSEGQAVKVAARSSEKQSHTGKVVSVKPVMGKKRIFTRDSRERLDLQIFEVFIEFEQMPETWPVGMEVDVEISTEEEG